MAFYEPFFTVQPSELAAQLPKTMTLTNSGGFHGHTGRSHAANNFHVLV